MRKSRAGSQLIRRISSPRIVSRDPKLNLVSSGPTEPKPSIRFKVGIQMCCSKFLCLATCTFIVSACSQQPDVETAANDWVLTNGKIYTVNPDQSWAEAVVIRDGKFFYVGDNEGAQAFVSAGVETTDLNNRMLIPGLVDAHTHPGQIDLIQFDASFDATNRDAFILELEAYAAANPGDDWLRGCCWPVISFVDGDLGPDRVELDRIFPDRPVWINSNAGHSFWLNSLALQALGLDEDSRDPRFPIAMYKRDATGRLTGWVKEGAGWQLMDDVFEVDRERHENSMRAMLQTLSEHGVTTVYDAGNKDFNDLVYSFLSKLDQAGELPVRYEGTYRISTPDRVSLGIAEMRRFRETYGGERLKFSAIKLFMDGVHENRSGAMLEAYADNPDHVSDTTLTLDQMVDFLLQLHEERLDLHVHVIGDLATKVVLDALELAQENVGEDFYPRVSVAHLQNVDPGDWPRFAELGVTANFTAWWLGADQPDPVAAGLGPEKANDTYRARAIFDAGGNVSFSSDDWTLPVLSPFLGMQVAHTRQYPREWLAADDDPDASRQPESEKLPLELLLEGYTINGAYQLRMEDSIGSIEVGKSADFVVLKENLFEIDPYALHKIKPDTVVMGGQTVQGQLD